MAARARALLFVLLILAAGSGCRKSTPPAKTWYDAEPLLASLRDEERAGAAKAGKADRPNALPLYDLELRLDDELARFELDESVWLTNDYGAQLDEVVLRIYVNATGDKAPVKLVSG